MNTLYKAGDVLSSEDMTGKIIQRVNATKLESLGIIHLTLEFTDGSKLEVEPCKHYPFNSDALRLTLVVPRPLLEGVE